MSIDFVPVSEDQQVFICRTLPGNATAVAVLPMTPWTRRCTTALSALLRGILSDKRLSDISPIHRGYGRRIGGVAGDLSRPT